MPSHFQGMDPYLENHWGDVHTRLITYASDQLQKVLPRDLRTRFEERLIVAGLERPRAVFPDVRVFETERARRRPTRKARNARAVALAEPILIELPDEPETQTFIEIRDRSSDSDLITVLEVLSPSNKKPGDAQEQYLLKQLGLLRAGVSLVEIDLLRAGDWVVAVPMEKVAEEHRMPYRAVVRRGWQGGKVEFYPLPLMKRLRKIRVPLRLTDADVSLDLQALIKKCHANGGYDDIDYTVEPSPPLPEPTALWAAKLLCRTSHRPTRKRNS